MNDTDRYFSLLFFSIKKNEYISTNNTYNKEKFKIILKERLIQKQFFNPYISDEGLKNK